MRPLRGSREYFMMTLGEWNVGAIISVMETGVLQIRTNADNVKRLENALEDCRPAGIKVIVKTHKYRGYYGVVWCNPMRWETILYKMEKWFK
jgi:hypothetical protein